MRKRYFDDCITVVFMKFVTLRFYEIGGIQCVATVIDLRCTCPTVCFVAKSSDIVGNKTFERILTRPRSCRFSETCLSDGRKHICFRVHAPYLGQLISGGHVIRKSKRLEGYKKLLWAIVNGPCIKLQGCFIAELQRIIRNRLLI